MNETWMKETGEIHWGNKKVLDSGNSVLNNFGHIYASKDILF